MSAAWRATALVACSPGVALQITLPLTAGAASLAPPLPVVVATASARQASVLVTDGQECVPLPEVVPVGFGGFGGFG